MLAEKLAHVMQWGSNKVKKMSQYSPIFKKNYIEFHLPYSFSLFVLLHLLPFAAFFVFRFLLFGEKTIKFAWLWCFRNSSLARVRLIHWMGWSSGLRLWCFFGSFHSRGHFFHQIQCTFWNGVRHLVRWSNHIYRRRKVTCRGSCGNPATMLFRICSLLLRFQRQLFPFFFKLCLSKDQDDKYSTNSSFGHVCCQVESSANAAVLYWKPYHPVFINKRSPTQVVQNRLFGGCRFWN